jgi:hypothetical protein
MLNRFCARMTFAVISFTICVAVSARMPAEAAEVEVRHVDSGWRMYRDGQPFFIQGAGGNGSQAMLQGIGGNCVRTWGVDGNTSALLDEAQRNGLTVCLGIWLGHERQGFDYKDARAVLAQRDKVRESVVKFRNHPALLMWGIGNEMEGPGQGDNPAIWYAVNDVAAMVKELDPHHPTMTSVAEINGDRIRCLHSFCPAIDIVGINAYGGIATIPGRYRKAGGTKPYVITEFGPPGWWEVKRTTWDAPIEATSSTKADIYRDAWAKAINAERDKLCLGGFAFLWGHKVEGTATWFGLLLPDGSRLAPVDTLCEIWSGQPPKNRCPKIDSLQISTTEPVDPGAEITARLAASDSEDDPLRVEWILTVEATAYQTTGPDEAALPNFPDAVKTASADSATLIVPESGGKYRLYAYVFDGKGGAATANVPIQVRGPEKPLPGVQAKLPLVVYDEESENTPYTASGWMGDTQSIEMDGACADNPQSGKRCLKVTFRKADGWGGVAWQNPPDDWGDRPGGLDLTGAKSLVFWARGGRGGERVKFGVGIIKPEKKYFDTARVEREFTLTNEWQHFSLDLSDKDLSRIKTGFLWTIQGQGETTSFYLDTIGFE